MTSGPVLVAVDFGEPSDDAVRQADARAKTTGASLVVCHVISDPVRIDPHFEIALASIDMTAVRAAAETQLRERVGKLTGRDSAALDVRMLDGTPHVSIIEEAERSQADLVVLGTHGRTGVARALLGSVAERTVRYAHCPVLIARPHTSSGNVIIATDFSNPALPAVHAAADEVRRIGGRLIAVHCVDRSELDWTYRIPTPGRDVIIEHAVAEMHRSARAQLAAALDIAGVAGDCEVLEGRPAEEIVEASARHDAELIVVGTAGRTGLSRVTLGSVAERVVRTAEVPVLVVRLGR